MTMLSSSLSLWDVADVESHLRHRADETLRQRNARLDADKYERLIAYLVAWAWKGSGLDGQGRHQRPDVTAHIQTHGKYPPDTYDPGRGWSFSKWLYQNAPRRMFDWYRSRAEGFRDTRAPKPEEISYDALLQEIADSDDQERAERDRLVYADPSSGMDPAERMHADSVRLLTGHGGPIPRTDEEVGRWSDEGNRGSPDRAAA